MERLRRFATWSVVLVLMFGGAACGDDPGEDELGDGEIIDEGD
jgi:hypothetical protein